MTFKVRDPLVIYVLHPQRNDCLSLLRSAQIHFCLLRVSRLLRL